MKNLNLLSNQISCSGCAKKITKALKKLSGIKDVEVNLETKTINLKFDETKTSQQEILKTLEDINYSSKVI